MVGGVGTNDVYKCGSLEVRRNLHSGMNETLLATDGSQCLFLSLLSRHYLPPVAASGEKDESDVRTSRTVQKG